MTIDYTTRCSTEKLGEIRFFVQQQLNDAQTKLSDLEKKQVVLAVDEACANAIIHGNKCDPNRNIHVALEIEASQINIEISDIGNFQAQEASWLSSSTMIHEHIKQRKKGGLGLCLMYLIMDNVRYYSRGQINVCALNKRLK